MEKQKTKKKKRLQTKKAKGDGWRVWDWRDRVKERKPRGNLENLRKGLRESDGEIEKKPRDQSLTVAFSLPKFTNSSHLFSGGA